MNAQLMSDGNYSWLEVNGQRIDNVVIRKPSVKVHTEVKTDKDATFAWIPPTRITFDAEMICLPTTS